jgi:CreA protein
LISSTATADEIGEVDTAFKLLGANHKIVIEAFDDPKVEGVTCFLSMARKGGISGSLGLAEDTSDASIACRQVAAFDIVQETPGDPLPRSRAQYTGLSRLQRQAD